MTNSIIKDHVSSIAKSVLILLCILSLFEMVVYPETENIYGCATFIIGWIFLYFFVMKYRYAQKCFLPFISLFGLGICFYFMPLLMTLVEGKPLTFRFQNPYLTFNYQLLNLVMLIFAFRLCLHFYNPDNLLLKLWDKMGYFSPPSDKQIWVMGGIGIFSQIFLLMIMGTEDAEAENLGFLGHLLGVTKVFACLPVLLFFKNLYSNNKLTNTAKRPIIIYLFVLAALGLATGKRTMIFSSFVTIAMCYIVPVFSENKKLFSKKTFFYGLIAVYLVTGPIADLAAAMALGRDNSEQTGAAKTFDNIINLYQDKERLHFLYNAFLLRTDNGGDNLSDWSEYYVDNIMMDRFCNLRVCDMTIWYANNLGFDNPKMHEYMANQVLFLLPTPILQSFGIYVNKFELQYTPGDLISMESLNLRYYHGYRVAGDVGTGLYLWGEMYFVYAFFIYFAMFFFLSSLVKTNFNSTLLVFPLPVLCDLFRYFLFFNNATGIVGVVTTLLRTGWQAIVVYCIIVFVIKKIVK